VRGATIRPAHRLSVVAVALLLVSGWLGWELIYRQGVGLSPEIEVRVKARKGAA
jgi:uncharacterized membrane protein